MNLSTHMAVGAAIGYATKNPVLGFFAGVVSHHILDQIPHSDGGSFEVEVENYAKDRRIILIVAIDLFILILIGAFLFRIKGIYWPMILGGIGAVLPDLIDNMPFWSGKLRKLPVFKSYHRFHETIHFTIEAQDYIWVGIIIQLFLIVAALTILV